MFDGTYPVGLDGLAEALKMKDSAGEYWISPLSIVGWIDDLLYRCRYCRTVLRAGDAGCPHCGAPKERQRGPS